MGVGVPMPGTLSRVTVAPLVASSRRSCLVCAIIFLETLRATSLRKLPQKHTKKGSNLNELDPESGGYLLSRNSVPSAIASLTSLFGMGRGGTSLP